ncbi:hypothetical protein ACFLTL_02635 [Chloroflexota bacterium]
MRRNRAIALVASIVLIIVLVLSGCGSSNGGNGGGDKEYRALNPAGMFIPVETQGLSPRLDSFSGKTIYVCQAEADPVIMPALYEVLKRDYPQNTYIYYDRSDFGPSTPGTGGTANTSGEPEDPDILSKVDAVIRGISW